MTITELKKYIYEEDKISLLLTNLGCKNIKYHPKKDYYSAENPDGDNPTAVNVFNNENLNVVNHTRNLKEIDKYPDLITLVRFYLNLNFKQAIKWLHKQLGLKFSFDIDKKTEVVDPLYIFKKVKLRTKADVKELTILDENILQEYVPLLHINWFREGITKRAKERYGIGYSYHSNRVIVPLRYWLDGKLLGTNARTMVENYKEFGIKKYFITPTYPKSYNLFGLWENYDTIQKVGYVIVYESEKSPIKRSSLLDDTGVALSGHTLSDEQIKILIGLNVEIIFCLDNDIDINEMRMMCENFYHIRPVSYMYDRWDLMPQKSCAADCSNKIFEFIKKYRVIYDEKEHQNYLKSLRR